MPWDTGAWDYTLWDEGATPKMTVEKAIDELIAMMKRDTELLGHFQPGAYGKDIDLAQAQFPNVVVTPAEARIFGRGPGWEKELVTVHVLFRFRSPRRTDTTRLAVLANRLRALLAERPRLDGTAEVERAKVLSWKPLYGTGDNFVEDVADVTVEMQLFRKV